MARRSSRKPSTPPSTPRRWRALPAVCAAAIAVAVSVWISRPAQPQQEPSSAAENLATQVPIPTPPHLQEPDPACEDRHADCGKWTRSGECDKNPGFMFVQCASSCHACGDQGSRCEFDEADPWLGVPKGAVRQRLLEDAIAERGDMRPEVISSDPPVLVLDEFLPMEVCDELMGMAAEAGFRPSEVLDKPKSEVVAAGGQDFKRSAHRTSSSAHCGDAGAWCRQSPALDELLARGESLTRLNASHTELQFVHYEAGQYFRTHSDYLGGSEKYQAGPRIFTLLVYLSDVEEGGETHFPAIGLAVPPRKGRAVLFASTLDESPLQKDARTRHQSLPVKRGEKYAANLWYYTRDYARASREGCIMG